jgi:predicted carbohydrate-binding protein with CBM5 and CBM33 domain
MRFSIKGMTVSTFVSSAPCKDALEPLGQRTDAIARNRLKNYPQREGIPEGHGTDVLVNRWLVDPAGSGNYRVPDIRLQRTRTILDGTIGDKPLSMPQVQDFINFSGSDRVFIVRPQVGPGSSR